MRTLVGRRLKGLPGGRDRGHVAVGVVAVAGGVAVAIDGGTELPGLGPAADPAIALILVLNVGAARTPIAGGGLTGVGVGQIAAGARNHVLNAARRVFPPSEGYATTITEMRVG